MFSPIMAAQLAKLFVLAWHQFMMLIDFHRTIASGFWVHDYLPVSFGES